MIRASIVGASGYAGGEVLRLLTLHPEVNVTQAISASCAGQPVHLVHPNLRGCSTISFTAPDRLEETDVLFLATPHGFACEEIETFAERSERVIDLSGDFRLKDPAEYARWYGAEHPHPEWLEKFVYGLPELHRQELIGARYASGVGCNASVSLIALAPLARSGLLGETVIDVKVGSSEGGRRPTPGSHHPARAGVVRTYSPYGHRHQAELIQEFGLDPHQSQLHFTVTSVDMVRGALATCHCLLDRNVDDKELWALFREAYAQEPFVRIVRAKRGVYRYPEPKILSGSNFCDVGFAVDPESRRVVVIGAIDNLMKGSAGTAVQTMNLMCGFDETLGLEFPGLHPI